MTQNYMTNDAFKVIRAIGSVTRYRIVSHLCGTKNSVSAIAKALGATHSGISHQLAVLLNANVVTCAREGREMVYQIAKSPAGKAAKAIIRI